MLVVALLLTAVSTGVLAREFCAADIWGEDDPISSIDNGVGPSTDLDRKPFDRTTTERAMTGLHAGTLRDAAMAPLIERIRKVA